MGYSFQKDKNCWRAYDSLNRKQYLIGTFKEQRHASLASMLWADFFEGMRQTKRRKADCLNCGKEFQQLKANQKFCGSISMQTGCAKADVRRRFYYENNPEYYRALGRNDYARNKTRYRKIGRAYRARKWLAEGNHTEKEWQACLVKYQYTCQLCKRSDLPLTRDHITPISKGGSDFIENIQPLCKSCNSRKNNKLITLIDLIGSFSGERQTSRQ